MRRLFCNSEPGTAALRARSPGALIALMLAAAFSAGLAGCATRPTRGQLAVEYYNLATAYFELEDWEAASRYYRRALAYDSRHRRSRFNLARAEIERGASREAADILSRLKAEDPDNLLIVQLIGYAHYRAGDLESAREVFEELYREAPYDERIVENLAMVYAAEGALESAAELLAGAAEQQDDPVPFLMGAVELSYEREDRETAVRYSERILRETEDVARAAGELGGVAWEHADYGSMRRWFELVLEEDSDDPDALFGRAAALLLAEELDEGVAGLELAIEAGFEDYERLQKLLKDENFTDAEALREQLKDMGFCRLQL